jgi:DNA polymerase-3 subunit beta
MKIICTQENLKNGLQTVSRIISSSNTLPILNNILLKTEQGQLQLSATNLEIGITTSVRCKVEEDGAVCVPAKILNDLVANLPNENITLETSGDEVVVATQFYRTVLKSLPSDEFPLIPSVDRQYTAKIPAADLRQALNQVSFAASTSDTQPEIAGVLVKKDAKGLRLVATDRYRLAEKIVSVSVDKFKNIIVPQRAVNELSRIIGNRNEDIELAFNDNQLSVTIGETIMVSRLVDGQYPEYEQIVPKSFNTIAITDRQALVNALKTTGIFSYTSHSVSLAYDSKDQVINISAASHDLGESRVQVPAQIDGPDGTVILNYRYVLDVLNAMTEAQVIIKIVDESAAVVFTPQKQTDYFYLVMPIKS